MAVGQALIVTPQFLPLLGGQERQCALLADALARRGYEPVVITEQLGLDTPRRERIGAAQVIRIPSSPERTLATQLQVAARLLVIMLRHRRARFAIVRTYTLPAVAVGLLKALRLIGFPTLVTAETGGDDDDVQQLSRRPAFSALRALTSANDVLSGICQDNIDHLREHGFPADKIVLIGNGIDTTPYASAAPPERVRRFLFLGRIVREKGVFELLEAFARVHPEHPDATLTIAGEGAARGELERRGGALALGDAVRFAGRVPHEQLDRLFAGADCLVLPSWSEGMPLSVLEAAAHRRVVIATDVGDLRGMFGERIRLVQPRDVDALASAMMDAVRDPTPRADYDEVIAAVDIETVTNQLLVALAVR
jgi:glycosyltransferase involved in cell wall biosynthesis